MPGRIDQLADPKVARQLLLERRGQAYFSRKLNELRDDEFEVPSLLPGWSRADVVAHVGYNARAVARLVDWAETGIETPMYASTAQRAEEIELGATLPVEALRNLSAHAAVHLDVSWRDLPVDAWSHEVRTAQGRLVPVSETVWMRLREVWLHAVDLDNGGLVSDFPDEVLDLLLDDLGRVWQRKGASNVVLEVTDRSPAYRVREGPADLTVRGTAADIVAWGTGRARGGVRTLTGERAPAAPAWL
jgi:maleylpyruvate isomerase